MIEMWFIMKLGNKLRKRFLCLLLEFDNCCHPVFFPECSSSFPFLFVPLQHRGVPFFGTFISMNRLVACAGD
jgi:hypothetical protein